MKIVITKATRIQELDKKDDKTGAIVVRGVGVVGQIIEVDKAVAKELINMNKATMPDSDEAKQAIKIAENAKKQDKAAGK